MNKRQANKVVDCVVDLVKAMMQERESESKAAFEEVMKAEEALMEALFDE